MLKKYKSRMTSMRILVNVEGKVVPIEFSWDYIYIAGGYRGCSFSTDDIKLQEALEKHEYFGRKMQPSFWTDDKEEVVEVKEMVQDEPKKVKRYKTKE